MGDIVFITGGGRSGKSSYAQRLAKSLSAPRLYVATATPLDDELKERISKHRRSRPDDLWSATTEEPYALAGAIRGVFLAATTHNDVRASPERCGR